MSASQCLGCGSRLAEGVESCPECGRYVGQPTRTGLSEPPPLICTNPDCGVANPPTDRNCRRCGEALPAAPGTVLHGRYCLERHLKTGGFGAVYLARDTRKQDQVVVVKEMIVPDPAEFKTRLNFFIRECEILRLLNEKGLPTVPRYYGFFQDEQERSAHLVMEYIPGRNLLEILEANGNRPFPFTQVVEWGKTLCDVLTVMHEQSPPLIHRDVKPDNIMLLDDGSIKMIDFGTARELRDQSAKTRVYSEDYAPPEQMAGRPEPRGDLFALAATLYHLVTGNTPTGAQTALELAKLLEQPTPNVPRWLLELLAANLVVPPNKRHPSAQAFRLALEHQGLRGRTDLPPSSPADPPLNSPARPQQLPVVVGSAENPPVPGINPPQPPSREPGPAPLRPSPSRSGFGRFLALVLLLVVVLGGLALGFHADWFSHVPSLFSHAVPQTAPASSEPAKIGPSDPGRNSQPKEIEKPRRIVSKKETLNVIHDAIARLSEERQFQRFFTLEHLHNDTHLSNADLARHRDALARLLRQFAPGEPAAPVPLPEGIVLRVDIRPLGWDQSGGWQKVLGAYPYGLIDPDVKKIEKLAGNEAHPFVRGDWFVAVASEEPLFSKLLHPALQDTGKAPQPDEAIAAVRARYRRELSLARVARELGLPDQEAWLRRKIQEDERLRTLLTRRHLSPLARGELISRESWSAPGGLMTPFQELAVALGLGTAGQWD